MREILTSPLITVCSLKGNAGAGGVFLASACDYVVASDRSVLNPHYRNMGLYGSEYWTYSLPKRVGMLQAEKLTTNCLPLLGEEAAELGLVDFSKPQGDIDRFIY